MSSWLMTENQWPEVECGLFQCYVYHTGADGAALTRFTTGKTLQNSAKTFTDGGFSHLMHEKSLIVQ